MEVGPRDTSHLHRRSSLPPRLQRHSSLTRRIQRHSSLRRHAAACVSANHRLNKSNPYVGSFRHAPPLSLKKSNNIRTRSLLETYRERFPRGTNLSASSSLHKLKSSPYIGWFRHAPPSRLDIHASNLDELSLLLETLSSSMHQWTRSKTGKVWVSGHLRGGAPEIRPFRTHYEARVETSPSTTVKMLSRVASWVIGTLSPDGDHQKYGKSDTDMTELFPHLYPRLKTIREHEDDGDESLASSGDEDDSTVGSDHDFAADDENVDFSLSSLAEAYYAHHATKALDDSTHTNVEDGGHRLDYVITQMDIARMARNASRHLDVKSILSLPTITYQSSDVSRDDGEEYDDQENGRQGAEWSWMIVPPNPSALSATDEDKQTTDEERNVCVICLEQFVDGDRLRLLPCNHSFHVGCIDRWLSGSHSFEDCYTSGCPTCKKRPEIQPPPKSSNSSVPSWAFTRIGDALMKDSVTSE